MTQTTTTNIVLRPTVLGGQNLLGTAADQCQQWAADLDAAGEACWDVTDPTEIRQVQSVLAVLAAGVEVYADPAAVGRYARVLGYYSDGSGGPTDDLAVRLSAVVDAASILVDDRPLTDTEAAAYVRFAGYVHEGWSILDARLKTLLDFPRLSADVVAVLA